MVIPIVQMQDPRFGRLDMLLWLGGGRARTNQALLCLEPRPFAQFTLLLPVYPHSVGKHGHCPPRREALAWEKDLLFDSLMPP